MKLQRVKAYKLANGEFQYKWQVTLPEADIKLLGWKEGMELVDAISGEHSNEICLMPHPDQDFQKKKRRVITTKLTYEEFRDKVRKILEFKDNGLTWTEIRNELDLDQIVPNNKWVRRLQDDIGLLRIKSSDGTILWQTKHV